MATNIYKSKKYLELKEKLSWEDAEKLVDLIHEAVLSGIESMAEQRKSGKYI